MASFGVSDDVCATNHAKAKRFISRLEALDSPLANAAASPDTRDAAEQAKEKMVLVVRDFKALLAKFAPVCCLKQAFRTGTDAEAFGVLYERMDDLLAGLPGVFFSGADQAVSRAQDMLDDSEDLRQLLDLVKTALSTLGVDSVASVASANASNGAPLEPSPARTVTVARNQLSKDQLELLQARLTKMQQAGRSDAQDMVLEQFFSAVDVNGSGDGEVMPDMDVAEEEGADGGHVERRRHTFRVNTRPFIIIPKEDLQLKEVIGKGAWGRVYRALWMGGDAAGGAGAGMEVAVKKLTAGLSLSAKKLFVKEVELNASLDHKGIVKVFGACLGPSAIMVMELAKYGNLFEYIKDNPPTVLGMSLDILLQIAEAMEYLHSVGIAHRDLKSLNVLVCERLFNGKKIVVRLGDFGLAKVKHGVMTVLKTQAGTYRWMAPEIMRAEVYKSSADIYSFAIVAYEVLTRNVPYQGLTDAQVAVMVPQQGVRPKIPESLPPTLKSLIAACWAEDPAARPTFTKIVAQLREFSELKRYQAEIAELESRASVETERRLSQSVQGSPKPPAPHPPQPGEAGGLTLVHAQDQAHAGSVLALVVHEGVAYSAGDDQKVKAWRLTDNKLELAGVMAGHYGSVQCLAVIPATPTQEAMIASGSRDNTVKIWSTRDRSLFKSLDKHTSGVLALAASSNFLFSSAEEKCIKVWSVPSMSYVSSIKNLSESPVCMAVHDRTVYAGMPDGAIHKIEEKGQRDMLVFTRTKHKVTHTITAHSKHVSGLAVSQGMLCSGSWDQTVKVRDLETNDLKHSIEAQPGADLVLGLVANGSAIYSCSSGGDIKVWDLATGKLLTSLGGAHSASVHCLALLNGLLISGSDDKFIKVRPVV
eukprot:jgi/Mesvir1/22545/Mv18561-RA.3